MFKSLVRSASRIAFVVCLNWMFAATLQAQTVSVVQISGTGVYERSPDHDGVTFVGSINSDAEFLVVVDGEYPSSTYVNVDLAIRLGLAAYNGTSVLGGTVNLIEGGVAPIFEILIAL